MPETPALLSVINEIARAMHVHLPSIQYRLHISPYKVSLATDLSQDELQPVFNDVSEWTAHMTESGTWATTKFINQLQNGLTWQTYLRVYLLKEPEEPCTP